MMICANCGAQLKDDQLLCEVCGAEVSLVPEFEPLIEESIYQTLSGISDEFVDYEEYKKQVKQPASEPYYEEVTDEDLLFDGFEEYIPEEDAEEALVRAFRFNKKKASPKKNVLDTGSLEEVSDEDLEILSANDDVIVEELVEDEVSEIDTDEDFVELIDDDDALFSAVEATLSVKEQPVKNDISHKRENKEKAANLKKRSKDEKTKADKEQKKKHSGFSLFKVQRDKEDEEFDQDDDFGDFDDDIHFFRFIFEFIRDSKFRWVAIALIVAFIVLIIVGVKKITGSVYEKSSSSHQAELARSEAANGNYLGAIDYMEKAINLSPDDDGLRFELADYYFALDEDESALIELKIIVGKKGAGYTTAYQKLVDYYAAKSDYDSINIMLQSCTDEVVLSMYGDYLASEPVFTQAEGTYEDSIMVEIVPPGNGVVYYTTDGADPTMESPTYYGPIALDLGIYHIKAMYVNPYGIESPIVTKTYIVDIRTPDAPQVLTASGTYNYPRLIEVEAQKGCDIFYTTDNTLPTRLSNKYEGPIPMPMGSSHLLFVAFTAEGVASDVAEVNYNLQIDTDLDINQIVLCLYIYDYLSGRAFDMEGHLPGNSTKYDYRFEWACTNGITFPAWDDVETPIPTVKADDIFYVVVERLIDSMGKESKTGVIYLINAKRGEIYVAGKNPETGGFLNDQGNLIFGPLIPPESYTLSPEFIEALNQQNGDGGEN